MRSTVGVHVSLFAMAGDKGGGRHPSDSGQNSWRGLRSTLFFCGPVCIANSWTRPSHAEGTGYPCPRLDS